MVIKAVLLIAFFGVMVGIGLYCRRRTTDVNGFVLGGRAVGPWLTAFAYGTSYFSAVVFVGYAGQFGWKYGVAATWGGHWKRPAGLPAGVGCFGAAHPHHDAAPGLGHHAGVFWQAL